MLFHVEHLVTIYLTKQEGFGRLLFMDAPTGFGTLQTPASLQAAVEFFADEDRCIAYLAQMRWPDGVIVCPSCNKPGPRYLENQRRFECRSKHPRRQFSVKVGTIFEDSPIPLKSWLLAVWQIANCKNGISSYELARALDVTQKTAWFMNHRIRLAMQGDGGGSFGLEGAEVEVDETYIGGKARNMRPRKKKALGIRRGGSFAGKAIVMGLFGAEDGQEPFSRPYDGRSERPQASSLQAGRAERRGRREGLH